MRGDHPASGRRHQSDDGGVDDELIALVVDVEERRPACVLLQAAIGGRSDLIVPLFDPATWVPAPNDNLRLVSGTMKQWQGFAEEVNARFAAKG